MQTRSSAASCFEFSFPRLDTLVLLEENEGTVVIRATRDSFTNQRKLAFIRELVAEGFIPEHLRWAGVAEPGGFSGVRWLVDNSWLRLSTAVRAQTNRFMLRLFVGAVALWSVLFVLLLSHRLA